MLKHHVCRAGWSAHCIHRLHRTDTCTSGIFKYPHKILQVSHQAEPSAASHLLFLLHKDSVKLPTFSKLLHHLIKHPWVELFVSMKAHCCSLIFSSSSLSFNSSFSDLHHQLSHCSSHSSHCSLTSVLPLSMMCLIEWLESAPSSLLHRSEPAQVRYVDHHHSPLHPPHSCPHLPLTVLLSH